MFTNDIFEQGPDNKWRIKSSLAGLVSTQNSTTTPLVANGIYTGTFEEVTNFGFFTFSIFTDQNSTTDGLQFQWSSDGVNVDRTESTNVNANAGRAFSIGIRARYFRVKYTNGGSAQTVLRIGTVYHSSGAGIITKPLDGSVTTENFAQLTQAPVMGLLTNTDTYKNIGAVLNSDGDYSLKTTSVTDSSGSSGNPPTFSPKLRYRDMNTSTGGVARGTAITDAAWVTLFSRSGAGILTGFTVNLVSANGGWLIRLIIDNNELFGSAGLLTDDLTDSGKYNLSTTNSINATQGINVTGNASNIFFTSPAYYPIRYLNSVSVLVRRSTGSVNKNFNAGFITLTEET